MKILLIVLMLACLFFNCSNNSVSRKTIVKQDVTSSKDSCCLLPLHITEENVILPEFVGGGDSLNSYIRNKLNHFMTTKYSDFVYLTFIIDTTGAIDNIKIYKEIEGCPLCQTKAKEIVKMMPNWIPAYATDKKKNKLNPIRWEQSLEIEF